MAVDLINRSVKSGQLKQGDITRYEHSGLATLYPTVRGNALEAFHSYVNFRCHQIFGLDDGGDRIVWSLVASAIRRTTP